MGNWQDVTTQPQQQQTPHNTGLVGCWAPLSPHGLSLLTVLGWEEHRESGRTQLWPHLTSEQRTEEWRRDRVIRERERESAFLQGVVTGYCQLESSCRPLVEAGGGGGWGERQPPPANTTSISQHVSILLPANHHTSRQTSEMFHTKIIGTIKTIKNKE